MIISKIFRSVTFAFLVRIITIIVLVLGGFFGYQYHKQKEQLISSETGKLEIASKNAEKSEFGLIKRQYDRGVNLARDISKMSEMDDQINSMTGFIKNMDDFYVLAGFMGKTNKEGEEKDIILETYPINDTIQHYSQQFRIEGLEGFKISEVTEEKDGRYIYVFLPYGVSELMIKIDRDKFSNRFLKQLSIGSSDFYAISSEDVKYQNGKVGKFIYDSKEKDGTKRNLYLSDLKGGQEILRNKQDGMYSYEIDGKEQLGYFTFSKKLPIIYVSSIDKYALLEPAIKARNNAIKNTLILVIILSVAISYISVRKMSNPLMDIGNALRDMSKGEAGFGDDLDVVGKGEMARIVRYFNGFKQMLYSMFQDFLIKANHVINTAVNLETMGGKLNGISNKFKLIGDDLGKDIKKISESILKSSKEISDLLSGIGNIAAATEEINATTNMIKEDAIRINNITQKTVQKAEQVSVSLKDFTAFMDWIGSVTEAINNISEQINMISINALIEANRAGGETGKAFGVIANKIKELVAETKEKVAGISEKIEGFKNASDLTINHVFSLITEIGQISNLMSDMRDSLGQQSIATQEIAEIAGQIHVATEKAANTLRSNADNLSEAQEHFDALGNASREITELSNEVSKSSGIINGLGGELNEKLNMYIINDEGKKLSSLT